MTVFILQNQHGQYLNKDGEWASGSEATALFRSPHHDVALNQLVEVNAKDYSLRGAVVTCELDSRGRPLLAPTDQQPTEETEATSDAEAELVTS
ncbi:hypothetical protein QSV34_03610 [Porticoccus sp. W117]|uniref:hypothetical protein n=1 Tax=Porticoccus sp. W117 TaxID=3054777 RepID=UPI0025972C3B|nr:hypothetical protein [Porticoccus sp. W117]MDM3870438.1 hypothetical protein [Porticoccus sp. W117]